MFQEACETDTAFKFKDIFNNQAAKTLSVHNTFVLYLSLQFVISFELTQYYSNFTALH